MLKKLLNPTEEDICPNCGKACAPTDVLCPSCGGNLDELFEQLPDSDVSSFARPQVMILAMNPKISRAWQVLNSLILTISLAAPWEVGYSDFSSEAFPIIGWRVLLNSVSRDLPHIFYFHCPYCMSSGLIAIGYLSLILQYLRQI